MSGDEPDGEAITGEIRLCVQGGVAHFPGRARERRACLGQMPAADAREILRLADEAGFFDRAESEDGSTRPDARAYQLCIVLGSRSRELRLREPLGDPALARLVSAARRLVAAHAESRAG